MFSHISNSNVLFFYCCLLLKWDENHKHKKYYCTQHVISSHEAKQIKQVGGSQMQEICTHYEIFTHGPNKLSRLIPLKSKRNERTVHLGQGQSKWSWHKCKRYVAVYEHRANKLYTRLAQMQEICTQNPFTLLQSMICMNPLQKKKTSFECDQLQNNVTFILSWTEIAHKAKI